MKPEELLKHQEELIKEGYLWEEDGEVKPCIPQVLLQLLGKGPVKGLLKIFGNPYVLPED